MLEGKAAGPPAAASRRDARERKHHACTPRAPWCEASWGLQRAQKQASTVTEGLWAEGWP